MIHPITLGVNIDHVATLRPIASNPLVSELNIGHSIIADAVFLGLEQAIRDIKEIMLAARAQGS